MTEETNDKILFRQTRYPLSQAPTLPEGLRWAIGDGEYISGGVGGGKSVVGSIIISETDDPVTYDPDTFIPAPPGSPDKPRVPTPTIVGIESMEVTQTKEGVSKVDAYISVDGMEGVEYEVVVSKS